MALLISDTPRWASIPSLRPHPIALHAFQMALIADAFCEELGYGRGSITRTESMRWALFQDPMSILDEMATRGKIAQDLEWCGNSDAGKLVRLADLVASCRFFNTWGVEPSKSACIVSYKDQIRAHLETYPALLGGVAILASEFIKGGELVWWYPQIQKKAEHSPSKSKKTSLPDISRKMRDTTRSASPSTMIPPMRHGLISLPTPAPNLKRRHYFSYTTGFHYRYLQSKQKFFCLDFFILFN